MKAVAIGTFDGVHLGHRSVLKTLTDIASERGLEPIAITFSNHPLSVIDATRTPAVLTPLWKKKNLLLETGVRPVVLEFNEELRSTSAREWMKILRDKYEAALLVVGYDTTFGNDGVNLSLEDYRRLGDEVGIEVVVAEEVRGVSSSSIRKAVKSGDMEEAYRMLGRPYSITSKVVEGNRLGRNIGFPTANIEILEGVALPKSGAYAAIVKTLHDGKKYPAMVNIGTRPTVMRGDDKVVEAHLINWSGDLYGKEVTVRFLSRLRDEEKFDSIEGLRRQLEKDRERALIIHNSQCGIKN